MVHRLQALLGGILHREDPLVNFTDHIGDAVTYSPGFCLRGLQSELLIFELLFDRIHINMKVLVKIAMQLSELLQVLNSGQ